MSKHKKFFNTQPQKQALTSDDDRTNKSDLVKNSGNKFHNISL